MSIRNFFVVQLRLLRRYFFAGIAAILPVFATFYIFLAVFRFMDGWVGKYVNGYLKDRYDYTIPGLGFAITLLSIVSIGILSNHFFGKKILPLIERILLKLPFVEHIYPPAKQLSQFLFGEHEKPFFQKVVLVEFPQPRSYALGFITNESVEDFDRKTGESLVCVLMPTSPSPFSGPVICVPRDKVRVLEMTVDQAIKFLVSGGIVSSQGPALVERS